MGWHEKEANGHLLARHWLAGYWSCEICRTSSVTEDWFWNHHCSIEWLRDTQGAANRIVPEERAM